MKKLFEQWSGEAVGEMLALSANGSNRKYWRIVGETKRCIAAYNADVAENEAFFYYSRALKERGVAVPELYSVSDDRMHYLQQDLGDTTLYSLLFDKRRQGGGFDAEMLGLYRQVLDDLAQMQVSGRDLDFSKAFPRTDFDAQSIQWDLNYFKYYFLKLRYIPFNEELLERDFHTFTQYLLDTDCQYFMYRDFQSRNIMIYGGKPYYIDYQGGRRGAAQYDVASLLYSAKSDLAEPVRQELLTHYIGCLTKRLPVDRVQFKHHFYGYVLLRVMQALGAYGYRGYFERKDYFLSSIPLAIRNLKMITETHPLPIELPHLQQVWLKIVESEDSQSPTAEASGLTVTVTSFSYKKGLPQDNSGNGGGYVFDCRALPNPGRYPEYRCYTGKDRPVIDFLEGDEEVECFLKGVEQLVGASIAKYLERNFSSLMVSFG
ncbi:MAG: phosphotransferase, partial [Bacteroidales bacterium]|nr:phosphotransferase [Bacteroidales bacterium]